MSLRGITTMPPPFPAASIPVPAGPVHPVDASVAVGGASLTQISKTSELMSKLGELSQRDPTKLATVTNAIENKLAARAAVEKQELAKRSALQAELTRLQQSERLPAAASAPQRRPRR
jgi:hypothetical protein